VVDALRETDSPGDSHTSLPYCCDSVICASILMEQGVMYSLFYDDSYPPCPWLSWTLLSLLRRPPGRWGISGMIFFTFIPGLLERFHALKVNELKGGSLTALPIIETEGDRIPLLTIPTIFISIYRWTDISLSQAFWVGGILPAVDVGRSVSRCRQVKHN